MDNDGPELGPALLRWINTFDIPKVISWKELQDGQILWVILQDIEPDYFIGDLPEESTSTSDNWIPRWQNLKHIHRAAISYIRDECGKLTELSKRMELDLKAVAIDASPEDSVQLAKIVLLAAMYSPKSNQRMVQVMEKLGTRVAIPIATSIGNIERLEQQLEAEGQDDTGSEMEGISTPDRGFTSPQPPYKRDPELEREEQLIQAYTRIKDLEERNTAIMRDLESWQEDYRELQNQLNEARYQIEKGTQQGSSDGELLEQLKLKANRDKDHIAELESELAYLRSEQENNERQLERLKEDADSKQKLRDELQLLKVERDDLLQKSKANENLKKKIQTLQDADKSSQTLRQELEKAQEELRSLPTLRNKCAALQKANEENLKTIQNGEQEIFDQKTTRKRLDHELKVLAQKVEAAKERQQRDQETMREQEERLREFEAGQGKTSGIADTLDDELVSQDKVHNELKAKVALLEAENSRLKEEKGVSEEATLAQQAQEMIQTRYDKIEKKYLEVYQENLGLDAALKHAKQDALESKPFLDLRDRLRAEEEKSSTAEKEVFDLKTELSDAKVRLQGSESKLSSVDKDQADALEELKQSASAETQLLQSENTRLLQHSKAVEGELDSQKSLLRHALLDMTTLQNEEGTIRATEEFKLIQEHIKLCQEDPSKTDDISLTLANRVEAARTSIQEAEAKAVEAQQQLHAANISELEARLNKAEEEAAAAKTATEKSPLQVNLQREISLMSSAWYDVTSRMQSDAVIVQRRSDAPKSFLNKQRRLVENPIIARKR